MGADSSKESQPVDTQQHKSKSAADGGGDGCDDGPPLPTAAWGGSGGAAAGASHAVDAAPDPPLPLPARCAAPHRDRPPPRAGWGESDPDGGAASHARGAGGDVATANATVLGTRSGPTPPTTARGTPPVHRILLGACPPGPAMEPVPRATLEAYQHKVPPELVALWREAGFGKLGGGLLELVDPAHFEEVLAGWLGGVKPHYVPFAITAFGDLFYYRRLSEDGDEDVCMLDVQHAACEVLVFSLPLFLGEVLPDPECRARVLREPLFQEAVAAHGSLGRHEVFTTVPAPLIGGRVSVTSLAKGNAQVYQSLLLQMFQ